jgi:ABC-type oligopeptide transport system ATPase subunit
MRCIRHHRKHGGAVDVARRGKRELRPYRHEVRMIFQDPYSSRNRDRRARCSRHCAIPAPRQLLAMREDLPRRHVACHHAARPAPAGVTSTRAAAAMH